MHDFTLGLIWGEEVEKHKWDWSAVCFSHPALNLEPGTATETPPLYLYAGPGEWTDVRRAWRRLSGESTKQINTQRARPRPGRKLEFGFDPSPVVSLGKRVDVTLRANSVRQQTIDGKIVLQPPSGWRAEPTEFTLDGLRHEQPLAAPVRLETDGESTGALTGHLRLESNRFDTTEPFTLIRLGDEEIPVKVDEMVEGDQTVVLIDNGWTRWCVAPGYQAGVVGWHTAGSDVNHLFSAFPQKGGASMSWLKPWFGGIQPILMPDKLEAEGWPGKLHEEQFTSQLCERNDERGFLWRGVCLSAQLSREEVRGLRVEIDYLTVGRSNLLKVIYRLVNETGIYWHHRPGILAFCQVDGRHDNSTLHSDGIQRKRTPIMAEPVVERWGAVTNPESGRTLVMVNGISTAWLELNDWGKDGGHLSCHKAAVVPPHGQDELIVYLALSDSLDEARRYAALAG